MGKQTDWQKKFSEGFTGEKKEAQGKSSKQKRDERRKRFLDSLSPKEKSDRQQKIKSQSSYKEGGVVKTPCGYTKIKIMLKPKKK